MGKIHRRKSIRLKDYDYAQAGAYFVTVIARGRQSLFGEVTDGEVGLSRWGEIVREEWFKSAQVRPYLRLEGDGFVVMPNHVHGIIWIIEDDVGARRRRAPTAERFSDPVAGSLPTIVRSFKAVTTRRINFERKTPGLPVWQRNYYEHVIRGEDQLERIRRYIVDNPLQWKRDLENPNASRLTSAPSIDEPWRA